MHGVHYSTQTTSHLPHYPTLFAIRCASGIRYSECLTVNCLACPRFAAVHNFQYIYSHPTGTSRHLGPYRSQPWIYSLNAVRSIPNALPLLPLLLTRHARRAEPEKHKKENEKKSSTANNNKKNEQNYRVS